MAENTISSPKTESQPAAAPAALDALFQRGGTSRRTRLLSERPKGIAGAEPAAGAKSKKVKTWRKRFRARIRAAMGGKCCLCGYDQCEQALDIHHIDPDQKEIHLSKIQANPKAMLSLIAELRKCALLCKNCHIAVHRGVIAGPSVSTFDERLYLELVNRLVPV